MGYQISCPAAMSAASTVADRRPASQRHKVQHL